jgi:signal transduction histidine kinase
LLVALTTAPLALRRIFPLTAFWTIMAAVVAAYYPDTNATLITFLAVAFAAYSAVVHSRYRGAALLSMPLAAILVLALFRDPAPPVPARATPLLIFIPIMIVGNAVHRWARRAGDSGARLRQAQAEHEAATRRALALERARLASELHDVVTHNVSMMVVQAGAARQVLSADPGEATKALRAVESSGRTAMTELRHLLGLLSPPAGTADASEPAGPPAAPLDAASSPGGAADLAPQPGLEELREMVGRVVTAGLPVELHITGTPRDLPPGLGLAMYRVVQEALTNVIKHAGKPQTEVRVNYEPAALVVEVADDGRPIPAAGPAPDAGVPRGAGMGLLGLRERVALYGGELSAGPRPGGGWLVTARIPVEPAEIPAEIPAEVSPP